MTLLEEVRELNQLIKEKHIEKTYNGTVYHTTLKDGHIYVDGYLVGLDYNTVDKRMDIISRIARQECYIQEVLRTVDIDIPNLETEYDIVCQSIKDYLVLVKKTDEEYIFIEYRNDFFLECGKELRIVKLNLKTNHLIFDRISFKEFAYYHAESMISPYTWERIYNKWIPSGYVNQNDLYDVMPAELEIKPYRCAYSSMDNYGDYVCDLDASKFDRKICTMSMSYRENKPRIFYL